jgi:hypothetical protein
MFAVVLTTLYTCLPVNMRILQSVWNDKSSGIEGTMRYPLARVAGAGMAVIFTGFWLLYLLQKKQ